MDRQTVVAVVVALEDWLRTDHRARLERYRKLADELKGELQGTPGLALTPMCFANYETFVPEPVNCLVIDFNQPAATKSAAEVAQELERGNPSIIVVHDGNRIAIVLDLLQDEEVTVIAERLQELVG